MPQNKKLVLDIVLAGVQLVCQELKVELTEGEATHAEFNTTSTTVADATRQTRELPRSSNAVWATPSDPLWLRLRASSKISIFVYGFTGRPSRWWRRRKEESQLLGRTPELHIISHMDDQVKCYGLIDEGGREIGKITIRMNISFEKSSYFSPNALPKRTAYPTLRTLKEAILSAEHIYKRIVLNKDELALLNLSRIVLSHLWKYHSPILADNIAQLYTKPRLPHEPVVKDDVLRYNPAEDLLIQINNLLSYFLETDEIKPVTADLRSEVIYEISQGLLLLEEVCEFHVFITYSQFQYRRDLERQFEKRTSRLFCIRCDLLIHREGRPSWHFLRQKTPNIKAKEPKPPEAKEGAGSSKEEPETSTAGEEPSKTSKSKEVADHPKTDEEVVDRPKAEEYPGLSEVMKALEAIKVEGPNLVATGPVEKYRRLDDCGTLLWCAWEERGLALENRPFTDAFLFMRGLLAQHTFGLMKQKMQEEEARNNNEISSFLRRLMTTLAQRADMLPDFLFLTDVIPGKLLGAGAFGDVFMGSYEGRNVALKTLRIFAGVDLTGNKEKLMSQFYREVIVWQSFKHEHVLEILGVFHMPAPSSLAMVSPLMAHSSVHKYLSETKNHTDRLVQLASKWIKQIARGMTYLHEQNVVHGDLRGDNIFLDVKFDVHIADFGLSVFADGGSGNYHSVRTGNPRWLAVEVQFPERFPHISASGRPTYAADVFSFACVCLELYTRGQAPFYHIPGDHAITMHIGSGGRAPRPVNPDNDEMPEALWNLVERCWREMPEERPTFSDISKELEIILS